MKRSSKAALGVARSKPQAKARSAKPGGGNRRGGNLPSAALPLASPQPDHAAARKLVLELMGLAGVSGDEKAVAECVVKHLRAAGCPQQAIRFDDAHTRTA
ncbi:MAG: hypothetical protein WCJ21_03145, partial [Planctomycetota bacterium]